MHTRAHTHTHTNTHTHTHTHTHREREREGHRQGEREGGTKEKRRRDNSNSKLKRKGVGDGLGGGGTIMDLKRTSLLLRLESKIYSVYISTSNCYVLLYFLGWGGGVVAYFTGMNVFGSFSF